MDSISITSPSFSPIESNTSAPLKALSALDPNSKISFPGFKKWYDCKFKEYGYVNSPQQLEKLITQICLEVGMQVHHCLVPQKLSIEDITSIYGPTIIKYGRCLAAPYNEEHYFVQLLTKVAAVAYERMSAGVAGGAIRFDQTEKFQNMVQELSKKDWAGSEEDAPAIVTADIISKWRKYDPMEEWLANSDPVFQLYRKKLIEQACFEVGVKIDQELVPRVLSTIEAIAHIADSPSQFSLDYSHKLYSRVSEIAKKSTAPYRTGLTNTALYETAAFKQMVQDLQERKWENDNWSESRAGQPEPGDSICFRERW